MRKLTLALSAVVAFGFTACDNAASKVEESGSAENTATQTNAGGEVSAETVESQGTPQFAFEEEVHAFGEIEEGTVAKHDFVFTNTGDAPLIITNAQGSCGCTVPEWPREPIAPGETGKIHVEFNSQGRAGSQTKQVTLNANTTPNTKVLRISAQVQPKDAAAES